MEGEENNRFFGLSRLYVADKGVLPYNPDSASIDQHACVFPQTDCYTGWNSAQTTTLQTNMSAVLASTPNFGNDAIVMLTRGNVQGIYFWTRFPVRLDTCPSISGLRPTSSVTAYQLVEANTKTVCRYALEV